MSTHSYVGGYTSPNKIQMSYCHFDGDPENLGDDLLDQWNKWERDTAKMIAFLGLHGSWSGLAGRDFDLTPESKTDNNAARNWGGMAAVFYDAKWDGLEVEQPPHIDTVKYDATDDLNIAGEEREALDWFIDDAAYVYIFNPYLNTLNCYTKVTGILAHIPNDGIKFDEEQYDD